MIQALELRQRIGPPTRAFPSSIAKAHDALTDRLTEKDRGGGAGRPDFALEDGEASESEQCRHALHRQAAKPGYRIAETTSRCAEKRRVETRRV